MEGTRDVNTHLNLIFHRVEKPRRKGRKMLGNAGGVWGLECTYLTLFEHENM